MSDVNKQLLDAAKALADEAFQSMVGGKGHLIDEMYDAIAAAEQAQQAEPVAWLYEAYVWSEGWACYAWREILERERPNAGENVRNITPLYAQQPAQPPAVAVPELRQVRRARDGMPSANYAEGFDHGWNDCVYQMRAMLAAAPQGADPIKRLIAMHNELLGEYPYCYFELAYTRRTDWMAWLCTKPREDDPERKVLACGQGLTAEVACAEAISAAQKGGEA